MDLAALPLPSLAKMDNSLEVNCQSKNSLSDKIKAAKPAAEEANPDAIGMLVLMLTENFKSLFCLNKSIYLNIFDAKDFSAPIIFPFNSTLSSSDSEIVVLDRKRY